jgi:hypothetical protein
VGKWNPYDHTFVPPGGREMRGRPGSILHRRVRCPRRERALFVDDGVGGCFIHGWPPCRCARCIVLHHGLDELGSAVGSGGTLTIVG